MDKRNNNKLKWNIQIKFVPNDLWIGLYWYRDWIFSSLEWKYKFYFTIIPTLPIIVTIWKDGLK